MKITRIILLAIGLLVAGTLSGCGSDTASNSSPSTSVVTLTPAEAIKASVTKVSSVTSSRFDMTMTMQAEGQHVNTSAHGVIDYSNLLSEMTMDMSAAGENAHMQLISVKDIVYMNIPATPNDLGTEGKWLRMDTKAATGISASGNKLNSPVEYLSTLNTVSNDVTMIGKENIRGAETTHYKATVDLTKAAEAFPEDQRDAYRKLVSAYGSTTIPTEVWISNDGLPSKLLMLINVANQPGLTTPATGSITMELFDYGTPVTIKEPAPGEYIELDPAQLTSGMGLN